MTAAKRSLLSLALAIVSLGTPAVTAGVGSPADPGWNRGVAEIAVAVREESQVEVSVELVALSLTGRIPDLGFVANFFVNDELVDRELFRPLVSSKAEPSAAFGGCPSHCQETGKVCICLEGTSLCGCGELTWIWHPDASDAEPGDEVRVVLVPLDGTPGEQYERDDSASAIVPSWNREVKDLQVEPTADGGFNVRAQLAVSAADLNGPADLSAIGVIHLNGEPVMREFFEIAATPGGGEAAGCSTHCQESGGTCICLENIICGCGHIQWYCPPKNVPGAQPGDEIMVILYPADDALPEPNMSDNRRVTAVPFWNRKVEEGEVSPAEEGDGYTVEALLSARVARLNGKADFSSVVEVRLNGEKVYEEEFEIVAGPGGGEEAGCSTHCQESGGTCICLENIICGCGYIQWYCPPKNLPNAQPGDELVILIRPTLEATPELPAFTDDDILVLQIPGDVEPPAPVFRRGDANGDSTVNVADPMFELGWLFASGPEPGCGDAADANDDGTINIGDAMYLLNWLFGEGPIPPAPGPFRCGEDPTVDRLTCERYRRCDLGLVAPQ